MIALLIRGLGHCQLRDDSGGNNPLTRRGKHAETGRNKPIARSDDLVVEELDEQLLVYDVNVDRAHSLSAPAARVWRRCDGKTSADSLGAELDLDADTIARALDELDRCNLLDTGPELDAGHTRREATIKIAKVGGAVAAAPLIVSLGLPASASATLTVPIEVCANLLSHGCGIDCSPHNGSKCGCCCCQGTSDALRPLACAGADKCCLPATQCRAGAFGAGAFCSDVSCCPGQSPCT